MCSKAEERRLRRERAPALQKRSGELTILLP